MTARATSSQANGINHPTSSDRLAIPSWLLLILAGLMGAGFGLAYLRWDMLSTSMNDVSSYPGEDILNNVIGLNYYVQDAWRFPLYDVANLDSDHGANIIFTDSLPILAPFLKAWYRVHPVLLDPFTVWLWACFILQGVAAAFLLQAAGVRRPLPVLLGALLLIATPALMFRYAHVALCAHFLLLFGVGLNIHARREGALHHALGWLLGLTLLTLLVHGYLWAMVAGLFAAAFLQGCLDRRLSVRAMVAWLAAAAASTALLMIIAGYIRLDGLGGKGGAGGFGLYSMNLLSPFVPQRSGLFPNQGIIDATGGQYEGYNYLGAGVLLLLLSALFLYWRQAIAMLRRNGALLLLCLCLTAFALSHRIWMGQILLIRVPLPDIVESICMTFRSSGRFFWPVGYTVGAGAFLLLYRGMKPMVFGPLVLVAVVLQVLDGRHQMAEMERWPAEMSLEAQKEQENIRFLLRGHRQVKVYPGYFQLTEHEHRYGLMLFLHLASLENVPVNTAYLARRFQPEPDLETLLVDFEMPPEETLLVFAPPFTAEAVEALTGMVPLRSGYLLFVSTAHDWKERSRESGLPKASPTIFPLGRKLMAEAASYWIAETRRRMPEADWTQGEDVYLFLRLPRGCSGDLEVRLEVQPFVDTGFSACVGETELKREELQAGRFQAVTFTIPSSRHLGESVLPLLLRVDHAASPKDLGIGDDSRRFGLLIQSLQIRSSVPEENVGGAFYQLGTSLLMTSAEGGWPHDFTGLSPAEAAGSWSLGESVTLSLDLAEPIETALRLDLKATAFVHSRHPLQPVTLRVKGRPIKTWEVRQPHVSLAAVIPAELVKGLTSLQLEFHFANPESPKNLGLSEDDRKLALQFEEFRLSEVIDFD